MRGWDCLFAGAHSQPHTQTLEYKVTIVDHIDISATPEGFHIDGYPNAVKVLHLDGPKAKRLADLSLHKADLDFASACLEQINGLPRKPYELPQALWRSAVIHYLKCFGQNESRFSLSVKKVYKGNNAAIEPYNYFSSLRNKHIVHDENSHAQCLTGAILNKKGMNQKIEKIIFLNIIADTLVEEDYNNLKLLIKLAQEWVVTQIDSLCDSVTEDLESEKYEKLLATKGITYSVPQAEEVHESRSAL